MTLTLTQAYSLDTLRQAAERGIIAPDTAACAAIVAASHDASIFFTHETGELRVLEQDSPDIATLPFAEWWATYGAPRAARLAIAAQADHSAA